MLVAFMIVAMVSLIRGSMAKKFTGWASGYIVFALFLTTMTLNSEHQHFCAECRWHFNSFSPGYDQIHNFLAPRRVKLISILHTLWTVHDVARKYIIPFGKIPWGSLKFLRGLSMAFPMERPLKSCKDLSGNRRFKIRDNMWWARFQSNCYCNLICTSELRHI